MTTMSDYTPDGWKIIMGMFSNATAAVSQADMTGDEDSFRESVRAIQRFDVEQHENELICSCIRWYNEYGYFPLPQQSLERQMLALREGAALVDMKTSQKDALAFKQFVTQVALDVARAYAEEDDRSPVSEKEEEVLAQIKEKLYFPDYEWRVVVSALANVTAAVIKADVAEDSMAAFEEAMQEAEGVSSLFGDMVYRSDVEVGVWQIFFQAAFALCKCSGAWGCQPPQKLFFSLVCSASPNKPTRKNSPVPALRTACSTAGKKSATPWRLFRCVCGGYDAQW